MSDTTPLSIALVDDHPIVLEGLKSLLLSVPNLEIHSFGCAEDFLNFAVLYPVALVLLDLNLPDRHGLEICPILQEKYPEMRILIISNQAERSLILQALQSGACGYILKNTDSPALLYCINEALEGRLAVSPEVQSILAKPSKPDALKERPHITRREKEILLHLAKGATSNEIAAALFLSPLTVETHRRNLLQKFGARNVAGLIQMAGSYHLLD